MITRREFLRKTRLAAIGTAFSGALSTLFPEVGLSSPGTAAQPGVDAASSVVYQLGPNSPGPGNMTSPGFDLAPGSRSPRGL